MMGLLAQDFEAQSPASPLMQGQAAVAARLALNRQAHQPAALRHDYLSHDGSKQ